MLVQQPNQTRSGRGPNVGGSQVIFAVESPVLLARKLTTGDGPQGLNTVGPHAAPLTVDPTAFVAMTQRSTGPGYCWADPLNVQLSRSVRDSVQMVVLFARTS